LNKGFLSEYFTGFGYKTLAATEIDPLVSHGHEFQGIKAFQKIFGTERHEFQCKYIHLSTDHEDGYLSQQATLTWYDSREAQNKRSSEYRLYYPAKVNFIQEYAKAGDLIIIARKSEGDVVIFLAEVGSTYEQQLKYLFGIQAALFSDNFNVEVTPATQLEYASRIILENIGIAVQGEKPDFLPRLLKKFGSQFPTTALFSEFARSTLRDVSPLDDPDKALVAWMEQEEILFRTLERHIVSDTLQKGFGEASEAVDRFIEFSLSVHNRRKSRAGHALENHLEYLLSVHKLTFSKGRITENKSKPDFIFPDINSYHNPAFPADYLTMLGVKTTLKDRWRQILAEADRIKNKHLLTFQPSITEPQTAEMQSFNLQLVVPTQIHKTYSATQQLWLMNVADFIIHVKEKTM
jgi:hypothetical protein